MSADPAFKIKLRYTKDAERGVALKVMKTFTTLAGAKNYAQNLFGPHPEIIDGHGISANGTMTIEALENCTLRDLFPAVEWSRRII